MKFDLSKIKPSLAKKLYTEILKPRLIEEKMLILLRQGKISKWFSGIGQEAVSVGAVQALEMDEYILPMHRNLGVFTGRKVEFSSLFAQFQGKETGFTNGRDRSFHFGTNDHHIWGMISHLGPQLSIADGIALGHKINKEKKVSLVFTGDGGASEGEFHEALNVAAVWQLPVIFVVENNGYGLSTPSSEQFRFNSFVDKGPGYGIEAVSIDGNNIIEVYKTIKDWSSKLKRKPRPVLIEANTFRMRGHEEASGTKYVPKELMDFWAEKDPIANYEKALLESGIIDEAFIEKERKAITDEINTGLEKAYETPVISANTEKEYRDLFNSYDQKIINPETDKKSQKRFVDAIQEGLKQSMEKHPELILMGQDIADYGGVFKVTEGFLKDFGADRVRNTPLCESAIIGIGLGLSVLGKKSMVEMQFADFVSCGFNQIVNNLAKIHYRWGQHADVVIRMPTGAGVGAGPFHSQSNEAWFFHVPGLKIVYPSTPLYAKGLLTAAIEDPNPYLYFEHKYLYRSVSEEIPDDYYTLEVGKGRIVREGDDLSIITYGMGVHWAKEMLDEFPETSIEIIDMYSLAPWDKELVRKTVEKTGKALILHEDTLTGGIGAEWSAWITEHCFESLDAPVMRVASLDTPVPFAGSLEENFLPKVRLKGKLAELIAY
jgi:2-oxoisovalerate dehydrogenase E1 component